MKLLLLLTSSLVFMTLTHSATPGSASPCEGRDVSLDQFRWNNRILVIFAGDSTQDTYRDQMDLLKSHNDGVLDRDLVIFSIFDNHCSLLGDETISDASAREIRKKLSPVTSYSIYLIGKDGGVKLKKDQILEVGELFSVIDSMPMRQREMRDGS